MTWYCFNLCLCSISPSAINLWHHGAWWTQPQNFQLVYFDTQTNDTRGVVDLSGLSITRGPEENKLKCIKKFNTDKKTLNNEVLACFSLLLITGHDFNINSSSSDNRDDTLTTSGDSISSNSVVGSGKKQRFELVFSSVREAKMFCFAVYSVNRDVAVMVRRRTTLFMRKFAVVTLSPVAVAVTCNIRSYDQHYTHISIASYLCLILRNLLNLSAGQI